MKIGIDISQAVYQGTGVGTYTLNLVNHLTQLDTSHQFVLFGASLRKYGLMKRQFAESKSTQRFYPIPPRLTERIFNQLQLMPIEVFTGEIQIYHSSDWIQPRSKRAQLVTTIHDLTPLKYPEYHDKKVIEVHSHRLALIKQLKVRIIADSEATKKDIVKLLDIPPELIDVVHLAAAESYREFGILDRLSRTKIVESVRKKYGLPEQYVLSVGTAEPRKNLGRAVEAFAQVYQTQYQNLNLVIVGKYGWGADERRAKSEMEKRVHILGYVDQKDMPAIYAGAQAFVYPSLYEGFGLPVLEAMTVGTPVVTSNRGSLAEVAGDAAAVANPNSVKSIANGLIEVLTNKKEYRLKGYKQAKNFSWRKTAEATLQIYETMGQSK